MSHILDLRWRLRDLSGVGEVHGRLNLLNDGLGRLVNIVQRIHACHVELEVCRGDLAVVCLEVIDSVDCADCSVVMSNSHSFGGIL